MTRSIRFGISLRVQIIAQTSLGIINSKSTLASLPPQLTNQITHNTILLFLSFIQTRVICLFVLQTRSMPKIPTLLSMTGILQTLVFGSITRSTQLISQVLEITSQTIVLESLVSSKMEQVYSTLLIQFAHRQHTKFI